MEEIWRQLCSLAKGGGLEQNSTSEERRGEELRGFRTSAVSHCIAFEVWREFGSGGLGTVAVSGQRNWTRAEQC